MSVQPLAVPLRVDDRRRRPGRPGGGRNVFSALIAPIDTSVTAWSAIRPRRNCASASTSGSSGTGPSNLSNRVRQAAHRGRTTLPLMLIRLSQLFFRTLREDPVDAEVASHRLLVRAGYIRRAAPGIYTLAAAGPAGAGARSSRSSARRWPPPARRRCTSRRCCRASRTRPPVAGRSTAPNIFRLKDRKGGDYLLGADARGDVHAPGQGPVLVVQGPAADALPDPDQVPRRGPSARRAHPRPRVHHEGRLLLRRRRRGPRGLVPAAARRLPAHLRPPRPRVRDRGGDVGRHGRLALARSSSPRRAIGEDTFVRSPGGYAANVEAVTTVVPDAVAVRRRPGRARRGHARTRRPSTRSSPSRTSGSRAPTGRGPRRTR